MRTTNVGHDPTQSFIGYARVSTSEQQSSGLGLDAQRSAIRLACEVRGWSLETIFEDAASGGSMNGRDGLRQAMTLLHDGGASGLVVAKLDRLSRSIKDFVDVMSTARAEGWALVALDLNVDTSTPSGAMLANVIASVAEYERALISQRTRDALAELKVRGVQLGRPRTITDEAMARIRELRDEGHSYRVLADQLNAEGVPTGQGGEWHHTTVYRALKSRPELNRHG